MIVEFNERMYYQRGFTGQIFDQLCLVGRYFNFGPFHLEVYR